VYFDEIVSNNHKDISVEACKCEESLLYFCMMSSKSLKDIQVER